MSDSTLWAILIPGPDDLFAMASESDAQKAAEEHNAAVKANGLAERFKIPEDHLFAKVVPWPHSAESHAESLASGESQVMDTTNGTGIPDSLYTALKEVAPAAAADAEKKTFIEVTFECAGTGPCVCVDQDVVDAMTHGYDPAEWSSREIQMTQAEYDRLPEFEA